MIPVLTYRATRVFMRLPALIAIILAMQAFAQRAPLDPQLPAPTLAAELPIADYIAGLPPTASRKYLDFRGLLIEEKRVTEIYPLLPVVFFDSGSARIPDRYTPLTSPAGTEQFDESKIPGGTIAKNRRILDIIGARMRNQPETKIEIIGSGADGASAAQTKALAASRGQALYDYLVDIWQISPYRIRLLPARELPPSPSDPRTPEGRQENRRVDIVSDHWEVLRPLVARDLRRYPQPDMMLFRMTNGIPDEMVASRRIEITRGGSHWHVIDRIGISAPGVNYNFGRSGDPDSIPSDATPYTARLIVHDRNGKEYRSNDVMIPVMIVEPGSDRYHWCDKLVSQYTLTLFPYGRADLGPLNERIIREFMVDEIRPGSQVTATGFADRLEWKRNGARTARSRANNVAALLRRRARAGAVESIDVSVAAMDDPLYDNNTPEGRFLNRTVQVYIESPRIVAE